MGRYDVQIMPPPVHGTVFVLAGPTASGKSDLALCLAREINGTVINADSVQLYRDIPLLTARPSQADCNKAPHRLYGYLDGTETLSAGSWRNAALLEIEACLARGRVPIVTGGTGFYLRALVSGLSPIPDIAPQIRALATSELRQYGLAGLYQKLAAVDPVTAGQIDRNNPARLLRAWEVWRATGKPLACWQQRPPEPPPAHLRFIQILLQPERAALYASCNGRFAKMIQYGVLDQVQKLMAKALPEDSPIHNALGYRCLRAHLNGQKTRQNAIDHAARDTRRYAKRQSTWFRNQFKPDLILNTQFSKSLWPRISNDIRQFVLTRPE